MDNASKNAKDMIGSLQMKYNRGRQAAITNELVDIITGKFLRLFSISLHSNPFLSFSFFYRCQCSLTHSSVQLKYYRCLPYALV